MRPEPSRDDVVAFINEFWGPLPKHFNDGDVLGSLGIDGDDVGEFMQAYRETFNVNLDDFLWYFHGGEEGHNIGGLFFKPPYARVNSIPISISLLLESAGHGRWMLNYPPHKLPKHRWDILINQLFLLSASAAFCSG